MPHNVPHVVYAYEAEGRMDDLHISMEIEYNILKHNMNHYADYIYQILQEESFIAIFDGFFTTIFSKDITLHNFDKAVEGEIGDELRLMIQRRFNFPHIVIGSEIDKDPRDIEINNLYDQLDIIKKNIALLNAKYTNINFEGKHNSKKGKHNSKKDKKYSKKGKK